MSPGLRVQCGHAFREHGADAQEIREQQLLCLNLWEGAGSEQGMTPDGGNCDRGTSPFQLQERRLRSPLAIADLAQAEQSPRRCCPSLSTTCRPSCWVIPALQPQPDSDPSLRGSWVPLNARTQAPPQGEPGTSLLEPGTWGEWRVSQKCPHAAVLRCGPARKKLCVAAVPGLAQDAGDGAAPEPLPTGSD